MFRIKRRRTLIRIASFTVAGFGIAIGFAVWGWWLAYSYRMSIEYTYQRALSELSLHVNNIDLELQKGIYAGTPTQLVGLSQQIWRDAGSAKSNLSQIPLQNTNLDNTYKFISQAGDFANSMSKNVAYNQKITDDDRKQMTMLSTYAKKLSSQLGEMMDELQSGRLTIFTAQKAINTNARNASKQSGQPTVDTGFQDIENDFTAMPSLIYDGPFSDNVAKKSPEMIKGKKDVGREAARRAAAGFLNIDVGQLKDAGQTAGTLPTYNFSTDTVSISVSKNGGYVVRMVDSRAVSSAAKTNDQALASAKDFLHRIGINSVAESYYQTNNNICVINFAFSSNGVLYYPDLIKVGVAMDNGNIISFDATGYLTNHKQRSLPQQKVTAAQAQEQISPSLQVQKVSLALIPLEDTNEALCYEFKCVGSNGQVVLDYFNVQNGREEQILILLQTPGGTLAK